MKKIILHTTGFTLFLLIISCSPARQIDSFMNRTVNPPGYRVSDETVKLHESLTVADLHSDALLWERDLIENNSMGHVDFPRLVRGNVAIQAFTIVSLLPATLNNSCNFASPDGYCCLSILQGWPASSWFSPEGRALYQIKKLQDAEQRSGGSFTLLLSKSDLNRYLERRKSERNITAGFIGLEGTYPLGGSAENVHAMFDAGVRMIGLTHFADSEMGGSQHGFRKGGLTAEGRKLIELMNSKGIVIDLSHASRETIRDILAATTKPVVFSHTGLKGVCDNNRNITDDEIRGVAKTGGVVGIGFFSKATCGGDLESVIDSIVYVIKTAGVEHVALGSDFDGLVSTPVDSSMMVYITDALLKRGFSADDVSKIMGGNTVRVLNEVLPQR